MKRGYYTDLVKQDNTRRFRNGVWVGMSIAGGILILLELAFHH